LQGFEGGGVCDGRCARAVETLLARNDNQEEEDEEDDENDDDEEEEGEEETGFRGGSFLAPTLVLFLCFC